MPIQLSSSDARQHLTDVYCNGTVWAGYVSTHTALLLTGRTCGHGTCAQVQNVFRRTSQALLATPGCRRSMQHQCSTQTEPACMAAWAYVRCISAVTVTVVEIV